MSMTLRDINPQKEIFHNYDFPVYTTSKYWDPKLDTYQRISHRHYKYPWITYVTFTDMSTFKGTNGRQKTYAIFHVYCIFYSGFMCQTTVIFGITKDGSLESNILTS